MSAVWPKSTPDEAWLNFKRKGIRPDAPQEQYDEMRRAWYAGFVEAMGVMSGVLERNGISVGKVDAQYTSEVWHQLLEFGKENDARNEALRNRGLKVVK